VKGRVRGRFLSRSEIRPGARKGKEKAALESPSASQGGRLRNIITGIQYERLRWAGILLSKTSTSNMAEGETLNRRVGTKWLVKKG